MIVFPGGIGTRPLASDLRVLDWVREAHATTPYTTSVCTGSLVLAATGVSSGIDMALRLVELLIDRTAAAEAAQLMIEYDPQPPFDCGAPGRCSDQVISRVQAYARLRQ